MAPFGPSPADFTVSSLSPFPSATLPSQEDNSTHAHATTKGEGKEEMPLVIDLSDEHLDTALLPQQSKYGSDSKAGPSGSCHAESMPRMNFAYDQVHSVGRHHTIPVASGSELWNDAADPSTVSRAAPPFLPSHSHEEGVAMTMGDNGEDGHPQEFPNFLMPLAHPSNHHSPAHPPAKPQHQPHNVNSTADSAYTLPSTDSTSIAVSQILEIIPNIEPTLLRDVVKRHLLEYGDITAEYVLELLLEDSTYLRAPKKRKNLDLAVVEDVTDKGKGKERAVEVSGEADGADEDFGERPHKRIKVDHAGIDKPAATSNVYRALSMHYLQTSFPYIPEPYISEKLARFDSLYAPTHLALADAEVRYDAYPQPEQRPYIKKLTPYSGVGPDLERIRGYWAWLDEQLASVEPDGGRNGDDVAANREADRAKKGKERAIGVADDDGLAEDDADIECQCCFGECASSDMVQCPDSHLFCSSCISQYAAIQLGARNASLLCMHVSGCWLPFPVSELRRVLSTQLMALYERIVQHKEIEAAGLEGLEECPFCEWKCIMEIEVDEEELFRCENVEGGCGEVSCRLCKKKNHLPKSCKEVEEDKYLDGRHSIEEAMTHALMRSCPKCYKAFIKEEGCNKMTCPHCHTVSCYVCRQVIKGYDHFDQMPRYQPGIATQICPLMDNGDARHAAEVKAAAEKATAEYKRNHPGVDQAKIKVDVSTLPPRYHAQSNFHYPPPKRKRSYQRRL